MYTVTVRKRNFVSIKLTSPWLFFVLAYGLSWVFWIPAALSNQHLLTFPVVLLFILGGLGPALAGVILTYVTQDSQGWRDFWHQGRQRQG